MALADYGFGTSAKADVSHDAAVLSLDVQTIRNGYVIRPSGLANSRAARAMKGIVTAATAFMGTILLFVAPPLAGFGDTGIWLLPAFGAYLLAAAGTWLVQLSIQQRELHVDRSARTLSVARRGLHWPGRSRQTIRFEEIRKITLVDNVSSTDMRARKMNWEFGRIDVTWRKSAVTKTIVGDLAELEPLVKTLRQEIGMA